MKGSQHTWRVALGAVITCTLGGAVVTEAMARLLDTSRTESAEFPLHRKQKAKAKGKK